MFPIINFQNNPSHSSILQTLGKTILLQVLRCYGQFCGHFCAILKVEMLKQISPFRLRSGRLSPGYICSSIICQLREVYKTQRSFNICFLSEGINKADFISVEKRASNNFCYGCYGVTTNFVDTFYLPHDFSNQDKKGNRPAYIVIGKTPKCYLFG